ncbi:MAG: GDCCVxC domain-containing (seleno)protein [Pseudomonadota bacterium]|nr:GDCCVxC domain-containing (seleno)protein [Pseudomonadota bacterium]
MKKTDENRIALTSVLTCPECGHVSTETMPTDACQYFYDCTGCGAVLRPLPGDCCVYCSYGTVPCPPVQLHGKNADCCGPTPSGVPPHD